jgi:hypothetical protein
MWIYTTPQHAVQSFLYYLQLINHGTDLMAEIIGILGTVAVVSQLVTYSGAVLSSGYSFVAKVRSTPAQLRSLLSETAALNTLLGQLQSLCETQDDSIEHGEKSVPRTIESLSSSGVFEECQQLLSTIERSLRMCEQIHGEGTRNLVKSLIWPFKDRETKES